MKSRFQLKKLSYALLPVILLLLAHPAYSERLPIKIYTSADGLGSSFVDYLMRDSRGFMWFCTRDGLSRFDGSQFITYRIDAGTSPPGFETITETRNGTYWVSTTAGLYSFDANTISFADGKNDRRHVLAAKYAGNFRGYIYEDAEGNLWMGSDGLYRLSVLSNQVTAHEVDLHLPARFSRGINIPHIVESSDRSLWLTSNNGIIRRLPDGRTVLYPVEKSLGQAFLSVLLDKEGRVWMGQLEELKVFLPEPAERFRGLTTIDRKKPTRIFPLDSKEKFLLPTKLGEVFAFSDGNGSDLGRKTAKILQTGDGVIWITTDQGLYELTEGVARFYTTQHGLPRSLIQMAEDSAANLWLGGQTGLARLDRSGLTTYTTSDGLASQNITVVNETKNGTLYVGTGDFYLSKFNGNNFQTVRPQIPADARSIWTSRFALIDTRNDLWMLTQEGLLRYSAADNFPSLQGKRPLFTYGRDRGMETDGAFQIFEDSRGNIWLSLRTPGATYRGLACLRSGEKQFVQFSERDGFPANTSVSSFAEDRYGNLWLGFYEGGFARYANGRFTVFDQYSNVSAGLVSDVHVDAASRLWIASSLTGVSRIDDLNAASPQLTAFTVSNGLSSNNVRTITEDKFGNIYLGTVRGVDRISPDATRIKNYSVNDGLASDFVVDSLCDRHGTVWFATTNGLSKLTPTGPDLVSSPRVWLGGLRIAGVEQRLSAFGTPQFQEVELGHTQNNLQIDFFGLEFRAGESLRYQYRLSGADEDWSAPSQQRTVTYANLRPGTYRFLVRAVSSEGVVAESPAGFSFRILPPVWARWWFILIAALVFCTVSLLFYRYRTTKLREINAALTEAKRAEADLRRAREERLAELEKVRIRIATDLHDDIGSSLTQIAILSEVARQQSTPGNGAKLEPLNSIVTVSNELVETMSDIVWAIDPQKDHLQDLVQRMRRFASDLLSAKGITLSFDVPTYAPEIPLGVNARREIFLIFKESLTNIVKHSGATEVIVDFESAQDYLKLKIADNGDGFDVAKASAGWLAADKGGHGVSSMKKRAGEMNGQLEIISSPGQGTIISFYLPLDVEVATQKGSDRRGA